MGWIQTKHKTKEVVVKETSKTKSKRQNPAVMYQVQGRDVAYHGQGSFIARNIRGENFRNGGFRKGRSFLQGEHARDVRTVIQRQTHQSFLPESYVRAETMPQLPDELLTRIHEYRVQYGQEPGNSDVLRAALVEAGVPDSNVCFEIPNQAHHIVEASDVHAEGARSILEYAGIDVNSVANGVLLPTAGGEGRGDATLHRGGHSREYAECINYALETAVGGAVRGTPQYQVHVLKRLAEIRRVLLTCNVPINGNVDPDWDSETCQPITINAIFIREGLYNPL